MKTSKKSKGGRPLGSKDKPKNLKVELVVTPPKRRVSPMKGKKTGRTLPPEMKAKMWQPGQSGNPSGKNGVKKLSTEAKLLSSAYRIQLTETCNVDGLEHLTWAEAIAVGMAAAAMRGETAAAKEMREVTEGKLPDNLRIGDPDGKPLPRPNVSINFVSPKLKAKK